MHAGDGADDVVKQTIREATRKEVSAAQVEIDGVYFLRGMHLVDVNGMVIIGKVTHRGCVCVQVLPGGRTFIALGSFSHS